MRERRRPSRRGRPAGGRAERTVPAQGAAPRRVRARRSTRTSATSMKKRSSSSPRRGRGAPGRHPRCSRCELGTSSAPSVSTNSSHSRTGCDDARPGRRRVRRRHPSRSSRSLIARHHTLPGGEASSGFSTPRCACQRMNDNAARRNGRCRGARPVGPWWSGRPARRAAGSSRAAATRASCRRGQRSSRRADSEVHRQSRHQRGIGD